MSSTALWFLGRCRGRWLLLNWTVTFIVAMLAWNASLEVPGSPNGALLAARITVPFAGLLVHLWLIAPAMATWEVTARRRVRIITAWWVFLGILLATLALMASIRFAVSAPSQLVPGYFLGVDDLLDIQEPLIENVLVISGVAALAICALGRPLGTAAAVLSYALLVIVGSDVGLYHLVPYFSHGFGIPVTTHPIAATVMPVLAIWAWSKTSGTSRLARKLDPR